MRRLQGVNSFIVPSLVLSDLVSMSRKLLLESVNEARVGCHKDCHTSACEEEKLMHLQMPLCGITQHLSFRINRQINLALFWAWSLCVMPEMPVRAYQHLRDAAVTWHRGAVTKHQTDRRPSSHFIMPVTRRARQWEHTRNTQTFINQMHFAGSTLSC